MPLTITVLYRPLVGTPYFFDDLQAFGGNLDTVTPPAAESILSPQSRPGLQAWFYALANLHEKPILMYRIAGIAIHIANGYLLLLLVQRVLGLAKSTAKSAFGAWPVVPTALIVVTLWLSHPVAVQSVSAIVQQAETLATTCMITYLLIVASSSIRSIWLRATLLHLILSVGVYLKVVVIAVVPVGILLDAICSGRTVRETLRFNWQCHVAPLIAAFLVACVLIPMLVRAEGGVGFGGDAPPTTVYLLTSARSFVRYVLLTYYPAELSIDRSPDWVLSLDVAWTWLLPVCVYILAAMLIWIHTTRSQRSTGRIIAWLLLAPVFLLMPTTSIVPTADPFFEHRIYFSMAFWIWLAVLFLQWAIERWTSDRITRYMLLASVTLAASVCLLVRTHSRLKDYATIESIWRSAILVDANNARSAQNWVVAMRQQRPEASIISDIKQLMIAVDSRGGNVDKLAHQLAKESMRLGEIESAALIMDTLASRLNPIEELITDRQRREFGEIWFDCALALSQVDKPRDALAALDNTMAVSPNDPTVHQLRGDLYQQLGEEKLAQQSWATAEQLWKGLGSR